MHKIIDIQFPKSLDSSRKNVLPVARFGERSIGRHPHDYRFEEVLPQRVQRLSPLKEALRMGVLGVGMVILINVIAIYYRGMDLKQDVTHAASSSVQTILTQGMTSESFGEVTAFFTTVEEQLWFLQNQRSDLRARSDTAASVESLLKAGSELAEAGASFVVFVEKSRAIFGHLLEEKPDGATLSLTQAWRQTYEEDFRPAFLALTQAEGILASVDAAVFPADLTSLVAQVQTESARLKAVLGEFDQLFPLFLKLLGDEHPQRFLILLENNHEARPGGGFIGSYVLLDLNDGYLESMTFHDVYDLDGQYHQFIEPPEEIARLTDEWRFRDSNHSPDMTVSAAKAAWFLEEEGGPGVDHVLTLDLTFVEELIRLVGPVQTQSLPVALDADQFESVLSYTVESKWSGAQAPKAILGEVVQGVLKNIREQKPWEALMQLFQTMAYSKHLSAYSKHESIQTWFESFGLDGGIPTVASDEDVLMVVHTSIGGNKTDAYVQSSIEHATSIGDDGTVVNQLTLTRQHTWQDTDELLLRNTLAQFGFTSLEGWLVDLLGRGPNVSAFRIYVPQGSTLLSASGIETSSIKLHHDADLELDYFYFTSTLYSGTQDKILLTYALPFALDFAPLDEYRLTVFKQPGDRVVNFTKKIQGAPALMHYRSFPEGLIEDSNEEALGVYVWSTLLDGDLHLAQLWGK